MMQGPVFTPMGVAVVATVTWGGVALVLGLYLIKAWIRRGELRNAPGALPHDVSQRLARIEAAVDSIAIEVERVSEGQRFLTKLQADKVGISAGGAKAPEPTR
jgi:hypothetical protein